MIRIAAAQGGRKKKRIEHASDISNAREAQHARNQSDQSRLRKVTLLRKLLKLPVTDLHIIHVVGHDSDTDTEVRPHVLVTRRKCTCARRRR